MPIPVTVLTGFLGSGKTTLLNRLLRAPEMAGAVVVVNEFGEIGLDHNLIEAGGESVVLLPNGCLCCAVRGDLVATLAGLLRRGLRFDRVVIETSGLADPSAVIQVLAAPTLARYRIGVVIATVDAVNADATLQAHQELVRQVALADHVLVTKLDLAAGDAFAALEARLRRLNPAARIAPAADFDLGALVRESRAELDSEQTRNWVAPAMLGTEGSGVPEHHEGAHHHHGPHERNIRAFAIVREEPVGLDLLRLFMDALAQNLGPDLLRIKALVNVVEHPQGPAVLHGAQTLLHPLAWLDRWPDDDRRSRFVFITNGIERETVDEMLAVLDRMAARTAAARARAAPAG